jgi:hypothetical protein
MYIVLKLYDIFYGHQLSPFDLRCDFFLVFHWFFCVHELSIGMGGIRSPTTTVLGFIYGCMVLGPSEYVWWNWVHWCWVYIGW